MIGRSRHWGLAVMLGLGGLVQPAAVSAQAADAAHMAPVPVRVADGIAALSPLPLPLQGRRTAPVLVELFTDYQCPACAYAHAQLDTLLTTLVAQGRIRVRVYDIALPSHRNAVDAGMLAHCARAVGPRVGERVRTALYATQDRWGDVAVPRAVFGVIMPITPALRLRVLACYDAGPYLALLRFATDEARRRRIPGTPSLYVNGDLLVGAVPPALLREFIMAHGGRLAQETSGGRPSPR